MMFRKSVHIENGLYFTQHYPSVSVDWTYVLRFSMISNVFGLPEVLVRLDRRLARTSVTVNKKNQFSATNELLRSFAYEYPDIITEKDYRYARTTQHLMELGAFNSFEFIYSFIKYFVQNPTDKRWFPYFQKRVKRFFFK
jgi:hypothetical protein